MGSNPIGSSVPHTGSSQVPLLLSIQPRLWVDPDLLEVKFNDCICALCFGVMFEPMSGCKQGHAFCKFCITNELVHRKRCPVCRDNIDSNAALIPNRPLAGMISQLRVECEHRQTPEDVGDTAIDEVVDDVVGAKRNTVSRSSGVAQKRVKTSVSEEHSGQKNVDQLKIEGGFCNWIGTMGQLASHISVCDWAVVNCPTAGCKEKMARHLIGEHRKTCTGYGMCPNEGCGVMHLIESMNLHMAVCKYEKIICPGPGCGASILRFELHAHVAGFHVSASVNNAVDQLVEAWNFQKLYVATLVSEQQYASVPDGVTPSTYVTTRTFNWRVDGWSPGRFDSHVSNFGGGVVGFCCLFYSKKEECSHFVGATFKGIGVCKTHTTFELLGPTDRCVRVVCTSGPLTAPTLKDYSKMNAFGINFTPTADDKTKSVRADGSFRMRAVIRLFRDR